MNTINTEQEVQRLLEMYAEYKSLQEKIASRVLHKRSSHFSFLGGEVQNLDPFQEEKMTLQKIGDAMKFQNPLIWLIYKYTAYKDEPGKALRTVEDLVTHCAVDGICSKRFSAINSFLEKNSNTSFSRFDPHMTLEAAAKMECFVSVCSDEEFQKMWSNNENDLDGKWANYTV